MNSPFSPECRSPLDVYRRRKHKIKPIITNIDNKNWKFIVICPFCKSHHSHSGLFCENDFIKMDHIALCKQGVYTLKIN